MDNVTNKIAVGNLKISQDVIAAIARVATLEIEGVDSLAEPANINPTSIGDFFSRPIIKKAITISMTDDFANIGISVNLKFGAKISEVCPKIQNAVKDNVQTMTGMVVAKVNVLVSGIVFPDSQTK